MSVLTNWFGSQKPRVQGLFFHQEPGRAVSQKGHLDSVALMSFLQLGQRIDCLWGFAIATTIRPVLKWSRARVLSVRQTIIFDTKFSLLYDITLYHNMKPLQEPPNSFNVLKGFRSTCPSGSKWFLFISLSKFPF
jgi:hypothetical protein